MDCEFRWATVEDADEIESFLEATFGPDSVQCIPGRFAWLYLQRPGGVHISLALSNGQIAGFRGYMPWLVSVGGQQIETGYAIDSMVAPEFRRQGIGKEFLRMWLERYPIGLSPGQSASMANLYRKIGFRRMADVRRMYAVKRFQLSLRPRSLIRDGIAWLRYHGRCTRGGKRTPISFEQAEQLNGEFVQRVSPTEAATLYTKDLFRWRFGGPVYNDYAFFHLHTANGQQGLLISRRAGKSENIIEVISSSEDRGALLDCTLETSPAQYVEANCAGVVLDREFAEAGFLVRPYNAAIVAVSTGQNDWFKAQATGLFSQFPVPEQY